MEIEAKFVISNSGLFARLLSLDQIGQYSLKEPASKTLTDHYLDTAGGLIRRGGFACRLRHHHARGTWVGSLKGLGGAQGAVHQREEHETDIRPGAGPEQWPAGQARDLALALSQSQPLIELFALHQRRHGREVFLGSRRVGELSLDEVEFRAGARQVDSLELEIELAETGTLDDLHALGEALAEYGLQPEPRSKFERGLKIASNQ